MEKEKKQPEPYEQVGEFVSIFRRGKYWYVHYRADGKSRRPSLKTTSKKQARTKALAIERDLLNGQLNRPLRAPRIDDVIAQYILHLQALGRSPKTIKKYEYCFKLVRELAARLGVTRINQVDLAFVDAFRRERMRHKKTNEKSNLAQDHTRRPAEGQTKDHSQ